MFGGWRERERNERRWRGGGGWEKGGENVMTVVEGRGKGGVLKACGDKGRRGSGRRWEKAGRRENVGVRA